jgi:hypothetical protein
MKNVFLPLMLFIALPAAQAKCNLSPHPKFYLDWAIGDTVTGGSTVGTLLAGNSTTFSIKWGQGIFPEPRHRLGLAKGCLPGTNYCVGIEVFPVKGNSVGCLNGIREDGCIDVLEPQGYIFSYNPEEWIVGSNQCKLK